MGLNVLEWRGVLNAVASKWGLQVSWVTEDGGILLENDAEPAIQGADRKWSGVIKQAIHQRATFIFEPVNRLSWMVEPIPLDNRLTYLIAGPWLAEPLEADSPLLNEVKQFTKLLSTFYSQRRTNLEQAKEQMVNQVIGFMNDSFKTMNEHSKRQLMHRIFFLHAFVIDQNWPEETFFPLMLSLLFKHLPSEMQQIYLPSSVNAIVESYQYWYNWCKQKSKVQDAVHLHSLHVTNEQLYKKEGQLLAVLQLWFDQLQFSKSRINRSDWHKNLISWFGPLDAWKESLLNFSYSWKLSAYLNDEIRAVEDKQLSAKESGVAVPKRNGKDVESVILSLHQLSKREKEVLLLIIRGKSNKDISKDLFISEHTVKHHVTNILNKLGVVDRFHAFVWLYQHTEV